MVFCIGGEWRCLYGDVYWELEVLSWREFWELVVCGIFYVESFDGGRVRRREKRYGLG